MVEWEAANLSSSSYDGEGESDDNSSYQDSNNQKQRSKRRRTRTAGTSETPEAAIARLTSAYNAAMTAVGALHKATNSIAKRRKKRNKTKEKIDDDIILEGGGKDKGKDKDKDKDVIMDEKQEDDKEKGDKDALCAAASDAHEKDSEMKDVGEGEVTNEAASKCGDDTSTEELLSLKRIALAARHAFEKAVLSDPLIAPYAPTVSRTMQEMDKEKNTQRYNEPAVSISKAHKITVKELAYLSLVNYADLILSCCSNGLHGKGLFNDILDRGAVRTLNSIINREECHDSNSSAMNTSLCMWKDIEKEEDSKKLALVSYCDAADLDGSDPTTWLKVACAARSLGRVFQQKQFIETSDNSIDITLLNAVKDNLSYSRLERYALERGLTTLRPGIPCNRAIHRAFREFEENILASQESYISFQKICNKGKDNLIIDLPRYSWSTLGRLLLQACRSVDTGTIHLKISPMLTLPKIALGLVCEYLGLYHGDGNGDVSADVKKLEATCRALSVDIISARALIEKERNLRLKKIEQEMHEILENENNAEEPTIESDTNTNTKNSNFQDESMKQNRANRTSKRVQSQLITSGKQAERSAKRKSVEYCLWCSIIPCTTENPIYSTLVGEFRWEKLESFRGYSKLSKQFFIQNGDDNDMPIVGNNNDNNTASMKNLKDTINTNVQGGDASLNECINRWSASKVGAFDMLHRFLAHISCHIDEICLTEQGGAMVLTSCILECFEILAGRGKDSYSTLSPPWYGELTFSLKRNDNTTIAIETLAINLLSAELQMRACERQVNVSNTLFDKCHRVKMMLPYLMQYASSLGECNMSSLFRVIVSKLQIRTYWLVGIFYIWWSKNTPKLGDKKQAEKIALEHIDNVISLLKGSDPAITIKTPQLVSPGRSGIHWSELSVRTSTMFRNELESSTVLSHCRQKFFDLLASWKKSGYSLTSDFSEDDKGQLQSIGRELFQRYQLGDIKMATGEKTDELIEDFITLHMSDLVPTASGDNEIIVPNRWPSLWNHIPTSQVPILFDDLSNPSFITMMSLSLLSKSNYRMYQACLIGSLTLAVIKKRVKVLVQIKTSRERCTKNSIEKGNSSDDDSSVENEGEDRDLDPQKVNTLVQMTYFLLSKFWDLLIEATEEELHDIMNLVDIAPLIQLSIEVSSGHCQQYMDKIDKHVIEVPQSLDLLKSSMLFASMINKKLVDETSRRKFTSQLFASLCAIVVRERSVLPYLSPKRSTNLGKSECQKLCLTRSHYISVVASEIAALLSCHQNTYSAEHVEESFLIKDLLTVENENISGSRYTLCPLAKLAESLAWFWTFLSNADTRISSCLRIPIAALIATLIGSSGHANSNTIMLEFSRLSDQQSREHSSLFSLSDYFESDDSAKGCVGQDKDGTSETKMSGTQRLILHALCRGVQCIGLVFSGCDETELSSIQNCAYCQTNNGYFLPLIIVRVLGGISDFVLNEFSESNDSSSGLWSEEYPFGFRSAGAQLDALLYKAYRCLHGIHLSSQNNHLSTSKDYAVPPPCVTLIDQTYFPPESVKASAQLYRCIMRAYTGGRRTIPVNSLECVLSALPHAEENASLANMKKYLYQKVDYQPSSTVEDISNVLELQSDIFDEMSKELPEWILNEDCSIGEGCVKDEVYIVRKGICEYFTENPLPGLGSSTFSSKPEESRIAKERGIASQVERAVYKKFTYIMESLTHDPRDASKWYRMGLCIGLKIDTIIDRLTQTHQCYNANDFYLKGYHSAEDRQSDFLKVYHDEPLPLVPLLEKQCAAYTDLALKKECILGSDFSIYLESQWSSYSSLQDFSSRLGSHLRQRRKSGLENKDEIDKEFSHWSMIQSKFDEGNIAEWQFHLGRMFAMSLQAMREKCFRVAFFLSMNTKSKENEDMHPEIAESLGTMYYSDIGFSLRKLTSFEKRQKSKLAQLFFQRALDLILQTEEEHDLAEYEIQVMIGKCQEKIAKTLESEACSTTHDRMYKLIISKALESYNKALIAAQKYEEKHGTMDIQAGGSAHGIIELIYRLHASRLKVLLRAIRKPQDEREMAETEALVITEAHWFEQPKNPTSECKVQNIRERVWAILADIVESMVHCRREQSFFHRSVYRHAQALLWAPLFHDPDGSIKDGSLATVPAHKSYRLRGLNSGSCAKSAEALLNSLFDKKRPQLCAVWVTTPPSPSPFEYMNDSKRKFDRIRWKYIGAFIDCMRLCRGRATLENFIKWCHASSLDLPSFYDLTATEEGEPPQNSHSGANLLLAGSGLTHFAKTYANGAVADIICREVTELRRQESSDFEWKKGVTELMGSAYKSFLRLNCPIDGCLWQSTKVKHQLYNGDIPEVEALCNAFMALNGIKSSSSLLVPWEQKVLLLRFAVKEAQKMFPAIVINSVTLNKRKRKRKACSGNDGNKEMAENEETASQKIIVKVPSGLKEGEKFLVTITCGYFRRKVQLVATGTRKIAFDLDVPKSAGSDIKIIKH